MMKIMPCCWCKNAFLSGMKKDDKLYPVSTLVFYYGDKPLDGSVNLHGLLKKSENPEMEEMIRKLIPNYYINLLDVNQIEDTFKELIQK